MNLFLGLVFCLLTFLLAYDPSYTQNQNKLPVILEDMVIQNNVGKKIDLSTQFINIEGQEVVLKEFFQTGKPVLLSMVYYRCPTLCNFHLNGVSKMLKSLRYELGKDFTYVVVSIEPKETPELAKEKQTAYINDFLKDKPNYSKKGWNFLVGKEENIKRLADSLGFPYKWNPNNQQWVHPAILYILNPDGTISSYLHGIEFNKTDVSFAITEASQGKLGNFFEKAALFCFQFDPNRGKYSIYAYNLMRLGGAITVLVLAIYLIGFWYRSAKFRTESM